MSNYYNILRNILLNIPTAKCGWPSKSLAEEEI